MIGDKITRECAGNVHVFYHPAAPHTLAKLLRKVIGPSKLNCLGLREPGVWAMLSVPAAPCYTSPNSQPSNCIEITRIECDEHVRGTGLCVKFVERLAVACHTLDRYLVMGCVESDRMLTLMRRHDDIWQRLASDPTSFVYLPSLNYSLKRCFSSSTPSQKMRWRRRECYILNSPSMMYPRSIEQW
jgi:hypothetical protein